MNFQLRVNHELSYISGRFISSWSLAASAFSDETIRFLFSANHFANNFPFEEKSNFWNYGSCAIHQQTRAPD